MRVATRIGLASTVLAAVVVGVLGYELTLLRRMADVTRDLSTVTHRTALITVQQLRTLDELEEHASKYAVTTDTAYGQRVSELREAFVATLRQLERLALPEPERGEVDQLVALWEAHPLSSATNADIVAAFDQNVDAGLVWADSFATLRAQGEQLLQTAQQSIATRIDASTAEARRATRLAWTVGATALGLTLILGLLFVRSITRPLRRLSEGTRAVAAGELTHYVTPTGHDEFTELTERFNLMTERLAALEQVQKELLSRVSHDLKTPLATMIETTRLLRDQVSGPTNPKQQRLLELTLESGDRLTGMISKLLDLSGLEASSTEYVRKDTDLADLVRAVVVRFEGVARQREIALKTRGLEAAVSCRCDQDRITSVVENLIENALKFAPPKTTVEVDLDAGDAVRERRPPSWRQSGTFLTNQVVMMTVADRGSGIPDRQKERIFQKFHQLEASPGVPRPGIGLGLAICREIVEAHDGAIWVEDGTEGGSVFYLMLPTGAPPAASPAIVSRGRTTVASLGWPVWLVIGALLFPACATAVRNADILFDQGRYDEAIAAYERMLVDDAADEERGRARYRLALLLGSPDGNAHDPARARALLQELVRSPPGTPYVGEAHLLLATQTRVEQLQSAIETERSTVARLEAELEAELEAGLEAELHAELQAERDGAAATRTELAEVQAQAAQLRQEIAQRDGRIEELERELERLKQIDLRRRPRE